MRKIVLNKGSKHPRRPKLIGGLAQLARAPALQAGGHRFDSDILHEIRSYPGSMEPVPQDAGIFSTD